MVPFIRALVVVLVIVAVAVAFNVAPLVAVMPIAGDSPPCRPLRVKNA